MLAPRYARASVQLRTHLSLDTDAPGFREVQRVGDVAAMPFWTALGWRRSRRYRLGWSLPRKLRTIVDTYRSEATEISFPFPEKLDKPSDDTTGQLLMTFTKEGLDRARS